MRKNLILPMNGVVIDYKHGERLYFLGGPNEGGGCWQKDAIKQLIELDPECVIATSCESNHCRALVGGSMQTSFEKIKGRKGNQGVITSALHFTNNTMWKNYYMDEASYHGAIIFWLPEEDPTAKRGFTDGIYARDVYSDIGRWSIKSAHPDEFSLDKNIFKGGRINMVIGAQPDFSGLPEIKESLEADHGKPFTIHPTLAETISAAVELAVKTNAFPKSLK